MVEVSIVMPVYNAEKYLESTINSVLQQTYTNWELLLIDDGSTDNSADICKAYSIIHSNIHYYYQDNSGACIARNKGIFSTKGKYIALIDSDDIWLTTKLEKQISYMKENPDIDFCYTWSTFINEAGKVLHKGQYHKVKDITFKDLVLNNPPGNGSTPLIKADMLKVVGGFCTTLKGSQDIELWYRLYCLTNCKFGGIPEVLCYYRIVQSGISANVERKLNSWEDCMNKLKTYAPNKYREYYSLAKAYQLRYLARRCISKYEGRKALKLIIQSINIDKNIIFSIKTFITFIVAALLSIYK